ncbi:MAG: hypothetical protein QOC70_2987 [Verrucomicrobiota bacterium]
MSYCLHRSQGGLRLLAAVLFVALSCAVVERSAAQTSADTDRADLGRSQTGLPLTGGVEGQVPPSPNDADLGEQAILKRSDSYQPFTAAVALPFYWTSNVALSRSHEQSDWLLAPVAALAYQPKLTDTLFGVVSVREQLFYYNRFSGLNFGSFDAEAGLIYQMPQLHNLILRGQFVYNRLTDKNSFDDFFSNYSILVNAELPFRIGRAQQLSLGVDANISIDANPEPPRRHDYETYIGYSLNVTRALTFDAVGRLVVRQYQLTDRVDVSEVIAASANYNLTKYLTASAISTFAANQSSNSIFDYKVGNLGGIISLSVRF